MRPFIFPWISIFSTFNGVPTTVSTYVLGLILAANLLVTAAGKNVGASDTKYLADLQQVEDEIEWQQSEKWVAADDAAKVTQVDLISRLDVIAALCDGLLSGAIDIDWI